MTYITLEYDGEEKSLGDWGFQKPVRTLLVQGNATFTVTLATGAIDDAGIIPFEAEVIFRDGRSSTTGAPDSFGGGTVIFRGRRILTPLSGTPEGERTGLYFVDAWYDLEHICYQQARKSWSGTGTTLIDVYTSELILFQDWETQAKLNTGEQLELILQYAIDQGAPFQLGTIEPAVNVPTYQVKDIMCSEAVQNCLRPSPDVTVYFDYTTAPATIHLRQRASLTAVALPLADGERHQSSQITPRPDLQLPAVSLKFKRTNEDNGFIWIEQMQTAPNWQIYPLDATGLARRTLVQTIDLAGSKRTTASGSLVVSPLDAIHATLANRVAWWKNKHKQLDDAKYTITAIAVATVEEQGTHTAVDTGVYAHELIDGQICSWMVNDDDDSIIGKHSTVTAKITYSRVNAEGSLVEKATTREFSANIILTNGTSGDYSTLEEFIEGEAIPAGLAQSIYESLAVLQHEGTHTIVEEEITHPVGLENVLNLTGGLTAWTTMRAFVVSIEEDFDSGTSRINFGPAIHLGAGDLVQLFLFNRNRQVWNSPSTYSTGQAGGGGNIKLGDRTPKENTTEGQEEHSILAVAATETGSNKTIIRKDAEAQEIHIIVVNNSNVVQTAAGRIIIALPDAAGHLIKLREWDVCDADGTPHKALFLSSAAYDP